MKLVLILTLLIVSASSCNFSKSRTNVNDERSPSNAPSSASGNSSSPTAALNDKDAVLVELLDIEKRWKTAKYKGDLAALGLIFADEFTNVAENGKTYTKAEWIALWKRGDSTVKSWDISDERLESMDGNKATISFYITVNRKNSKVFRGRDTDTFIHRDGRWQVIASQSSKN